MLNPNTTYYINNLEVPGRYFCDIKIESCSPENFVGQNVSFNSVRVTIVSYKHFQNSRLIISSHSANSILHPSDKFDFVRGIKVALTKAMKQFGWVVRKNLWEQILEKCPELRD